MPRGHERRGHVQAGHRARDDKLERSQMAENAGSEGSLVLEKVKDQEFGFGWNAATDNYGDLLELGVIDPSTVTMQVA